MQQHPKRNSHNEPLVTKRQPHKLKDGRGTFLGFREINDGKAATKKTELKSTVDPLMPDGGMNPCVIRVLGVGGGGCNAVSSFCITNGFLFA